MRLKRRGLMEGYIKVPELSKNGKQHLHVLFRGSYIDQVVISKWWKEIHHAKIVDIRKMKYGRSKRSLACYMAKYMSKENIYRYSWNWGWVWRGFVKDWTDLKRRFFALQKVFPNAKFSYILSVWADCLHRGIRHPVQFLPMPIT